MKNARARRAKILFSNVKYANLWGFCCRRRRGCLSSLIGRLSIDDGDGNDNATNKQFDWSREENKRAARVAHTHGQVRQHPLQNNVKLQCLPF